MNTETEETKQGHILYVDDEEGNLLAFVASFRKYYEKIYTATSAKEAMEIMHKHPIDVVLTDQRMPDMTGVQLLEAISPEFPDTFRLIVTGFSDIDAVISSINTGKVFRYIKKPWNATELKQSIDQAIESRRLELSNRQLMASMQKEIIKKHKILNIFQKYVPENIIKETITSDKDSFPVTYSHLSKVAVLFCDISGFIKPANKKESDEIINFLNEYLNILDECIDRHRGFINKFIGSGVLVIFGAPASYPENTYNAIYCALNMVSLLEKLNKSYQEKFGKTLNIGIGITTGETIIGYLGSPKYIEYTALGDTINTAIRLQHLTQEMFKEVLITQQTYDEVKDRFECEPLEIRRNEETINVYMVIKPIPPK